MMTLEENWPEIKNLFKQSFKSSLHFSIASINESGEPHITPIGSLVLGKPGSGLYFEQFTKNLPNNLKTDKHVCILAVNSSRWLWLTSLIKGKFNDTPAVRLYGIASEPRRATEKERELFQRRIRPLKFTRGYRLMWSDMSTVREIKFTRIEPVNLGMMTTSVN